MRRLPWLLFALIAAIYAQVSAHAFVIIDDPLYIAENELVRGGLSWRGLLWAFTTTQGGHWHPLTWLSLMSDVTLFGVHAGLHASMNVALHLVGTGLVHAVIARLTVRPHAAWLGAAIFALHPLRVESVAWITERKDVLSGAFGWLAVLAYLTYVARPGARRMVPVCAAFAAALLAKPTWVVLPLLLLVLDAWPFARLGRAALREKAPLLLLSGLAAAWTLWAQSREGAVVPLPLLERLASVPVNVLRYLGLVVFPHDLAVLYPRAPIPAWVSLAASLACALLAALVWRMRDTRPHWAMGSAWFAIACLPVSGLVQAGGQSIADRFSYLPSFGLAFALACELSPRRWRFARAALAFALAAFSFVQIRHWRDSESLLRHALAITGPQFFLLNNLGVALDRAGRMHDAGAAYQEATLLNPTYPEASNNYGTYLARTGRMREAIPYFERALASRPSYAKAHYHLALALSGTDPQASRTHMDKALALDPEVALSTR